MLATLLSIRLHVTRSREGVFEDPLSDHCSIALMPYLGETEVGRTREGRLVDLRSFPAFRVIRRSRWKPFRIVCRDSRRGGPVVEIRWRPAARAARKVDIDSKRLKGVEKLVA